MCDIKRAIFAESEVKTKNKGFHFGNPHISAGLLRHFLLLLYDFMHISSFMMSTKRNQATQKSFQATQLWVEAHRLRTMDLDCANYSYTSKFFVNYILFLLLKQKQTQTLNQPRTLLCKQTKKKNGLTATTNHSNRTRTAQNFFQSLFFCFVFLLFLFDHQLK